MEVRQKLTVCFRKRFVQKSTLLERGKRWFELSDISVDTFQLSGYVIFTTLYSFDTVSTYMNSLIIAFLFILIKSGFRSVTAASGSMIPPPAVLDTSMLT